MILGVWISWKPFADRQLLNSYKHDDNSTGKKLER
jgi:hypothetical protein